MEKIVFVVGKFRFLTQPRTKKTGMTCIFLITDFQERFSGIGKRQE